VLRRDWRAADAAAQRLIAGPALFGRLIGWFARHAIALYHGKSSEAQGYVREALAIAPPTLTALVYLVQGDLHLDRGELALARKAAEDALADGKGSPNELEALAQLAVTLAVSGEQAAATEKLSAYRAAVEKLQLPQLQRTLLYTEGKVALARRDAASAIDRLTKAEATLRPRPSADDEPGPHVWIWDALAQAHLAAGDRNAAARWFQKIVDNGIERVYDPVRFVRSHYFLAQLAEERGDTAKAKDLYARFVEYWGDGDIDRERVSTARAKR
jgi:tetratricopeptide (TPR) repeat protein